MIKRLSYIKVFFCIHAIVNVSLAKCISCQSDNNCNTTTSNEIISSFPICNRDKQLCVNENNLLGIECPCQSGKDCESGRCEGAFRSTCQPRLEAGAWCNQDSDCESGNCANFKFACLETTIEPTAVPVSSYSMEPTFYRPHTQKHRVTTPLLCQHKTTRDAYNKKKAETHSLLFWFGFLVDQRSFVRFFVVFVNLIKKHRTVRMVT